MELISGIKKIFPDVRFKDSEIQTEKNIAVFLHTFVPGGSIVAAYEMVRRLIQDGYHPWVIGYSDGGYLEKFRKMGVPCGVSGHILNTSDIREFLLSAFDAVILNSVASFPYAYYFLNTTMPVIWWVHEVAEMMKEATALFPLPAGISDNFRFAGAAKAAQEAVRSVYGKECDLIPVTVEDRREAYLPEKPDDGKVHFLIPGTYDPIKGQDILMQAIARLPQEYAQKAEFLFCGSTLEANKKYADLMRKYAETLPNVRVTGALPREELYREYARCDCVTAPSRMDLNPLSVIEGMMFGKLTIASSAAGISMYMQDCVNGFVFPSENVEELYKRLILVISDHENLAPVAEAGRRVYEESFGANVRRMTEMLP